MRIYNEIDKFGVKINFDEIVESKLFDKMIKEDSADKIQNLKEKLNDLLTVKKQEVLDEFNTKIIRNRKELQKFESQYKIVRNEDKKAELLKNIESQKNYIEWLEYRVKDIQEDVSSLEEEFPNTNAPCPPWLVVSSTFHIPSTSMMWAPS